MGEVNYRPIIQDMTWSYSRIKSFGDCPYRWFLKYIQPILLIRQVFGGERPTKADIDAAYVRSELEKDDVGILYSQLLYVEMDVVRQRSASACLRQFP